MDHTKEHHSKDSIHHGHPGFNHAAAGIASRQGIPIAHAKAILASSTRHASAHAVHANPHLLHVKGGQHHH
jgi:hypothetical protein